VISEFLTRNALHVQDLSAGLAPDNPRSILRPGAAVCVDPEFLGALHAIASETDAPRGRLPLESPTDILDARIAWLRSQADECAAAVESAGAAADVREMMAHGIISARLPAEKSEDRRERLGMRTEWGRIADPPEIAPEPFVDIVAVTCERCADRWVDLEALEALVEGLAV
jgi:hypothetical protein